MRTREQFERTLALVSEVALQLSELGLQSYLQKEELAYRQEVEVELRDENAKLEGYHKYDKLTEVFSRAYYEERLKELVDKKQYPIVLISGDMNNLKLYNDVFGHHMGDLALQTIADILKKEAGNDFIIGRCGGDEFNIAIPYGTQEMAEAYFKRVNRACKVADVIIPPSVSLGYYVWENESVDMNYAIRQAEEVMYSAKTKKKCTENINRDIMKILYRKQYLSEKQVNAAVKRVGRFGKFLGLDEYTIDVLKLAARLQDVGLIGVPEGIVKKETSRTPEEYGQMSKHTAIGYRLARLYDESLPAADIILQSHECWFGKGYPNQLREKDILYTARILYMVSAYSGWIYPKPTGSGMKVEDARERLKKEAGKQFDPELVEQFMCFLEKKES